MGVNWKSDAKHKKLINLDGETRAPPKALDTRSREKNDSFNAFKNASEQSTSFIDPQGSIKRIVYKQWNNFPFHECL